MACFNFLNVTLYIQIQYLLRLRFLKLPTWENSNPLIGEEIWLTDRPGQLIEVLDTLSLNPCEITSKTITKRRQFNLYSLVEFNGISILKTSYLLSKTEWSIFKCITSVDPVSSWQFVCDKLGNLENPRRPIFYFITLILTRKVGITNFVFINLKCHL